MSKMMKELRSIPRCVLGPGVSYCWPKSQCIEGWSYFPQHVSFSEAFLVNWLLSTKTRTFRSDSPSWQERNIFGCRAPNDPLKKYPKSIIRSCPFPAMSSRTLSSFLFIAYCTIYVSAASGSASSPFARRDVTCPAGQYASTVGGVTSCYNCLAGSYSARTFFSCVVFLSPNLRTFRFWCHILYTSFPRVLRSECRG